MEKKLDPAFVRDALIFIGTIQTTPVSIEVKAELEHCIKHIEGSCASLTVYLQAMLIKAAPHAIYKNTGRYKLFAMRLLNEFYSRMHSCIVQLHQNAQYMKTFNIMTDIDDLKLVSSVWADELSRLNLQTDMYEAIVAFEIANPEQPDQIQVIKEFFNNYTYVLSKMEYDIAMRINMFRRVFDFPEVADRPMFE